jgi:hypothetical protein
MLKDIRKLPPLTDEQARAIDAALIDQRNPRHWHDPWKAV